MIIQAAKYTSLLVWLSILFLPGMVYAKEEPAKPAVETPKDKPEFPTIEETVKDFEKKDGFFDLYKKGEKVYMEISPEKLNKPFLMSLSLARGIAQGFLMSGMTLRESIYYWKLADKKLFFIEKNVRHTADPKNPIKSAVEKGFQDSIIAALSIQAKSGGTYLINLADFLFTDYAELSQELSWTGMGGYRLDPNRTTWGLIKNFPFNTEIEVAATYAGGNSGDARTVPDARALSLTTRYSFSKIPETGYKTRVADDRIGYFLTAKKDYSMKTSQEPFVRYVNRWNLQKANPEAELSPPVKPIIFYIEKSIPYDYRPAVQAGILEWNKAFEKAGFINAIEVRIQEDDAEWDAEDVRYNTVRWMTGEAGYAIGPSRTNPETGEIYDADVLVDSEWLNYFEWNYEIFVKPGTSTKIDLAALAENDPQAWKQFINELRGIPNSQTKSLAGNYPWMERWESQRCEYALGLRQEMAIAAAASLVSGATAPKNQLQDFIYQGLKDLITHEVGHTLGLRHNFKSSSMIPLADLFDKEKCEKQGMVGSVMDYDQAVIAPPGQEQGYYFSPTLGAWDLLAIEYGYKECSNDALKEIAARASKPPYMYGTDGDVNRIDPLTNTRDMSNDLIGWAQLRTKVFTHIWEKLSDKVVQKGESYDKLRSAFINTLFGLAMDLYHATGFVGGIYLNRDHKGDAGEDPIFQIVPAAKQREALKLACDVAIKGDIFQFDPELLARLAPNFWDHWGVSGSRRDVNLHMYIFEIQSLILSQLLSYPVLERAHNASLYRKGDEGLITIDEIYRTVTDAVFSELKQDPQLTQWTAEKPFIRSQRRDLQRFYLKFFLLMDMLTDPSQSMYVPQDLRSTAWAVTKDLKNTLDAFLKKVNDGKIKLDPMSDSHLRETQERINKALEAAMNLDEYPRSVGR